MPSYIPHWMIYCLSTAILVLNISFYLICRSFISQCLFICMVTYLIHLFNIVLLARMFLLAQIRMMINSWYVLMRARSNYLLQIMKKMFHRIRGISPLLVLTEHVNFLPYLSSIWFQWMLLLQVLFCYQSCGYNFFIFYLLIYN